MSYHDENDTLTDDLDILEDDDTDDSGRGDEWERQEGCLFPDRCICAGEHTTDECLTAEMADAYEQEIGIDDPS